jgi:hypothetical protein
MLGSACDSPGAGRAGPPAHMIAFQASHSCRSASRSFSSAATLYNSSHATRAPGESPLPAPFGRRRRVGSNSRGHAPDHRANRRKHTVPTSVSAQTAAIDGICGNCGKHSGVQISPKCLKRWIGGDGGIRTLDRALQPYNGLANRRLQPLGHVSCMADMPDVALRRKRQIVCF